MRNTSWQVTSNWFCVDHVGHELVSVFHTTSGPPNFLIVRMGPGWAIRSCDPVTSSSVSGSWQNYCIGIVMFMTELRNRRISLFSSRPIVRSKNCQFKTVFWKKCSEESFSYIIRLLHARNSPDQSQLLSFIESVASCSSSYCVKFNVVWTVAMYITHH